MRASTICGNSQKKKKKGKLDIWTFISKKREEMAISLNT